MPHAPSGTDRDRPVKPGKIPPALLQEMLALPRRTDPAVVVGPVPGEDAAVIRPAAGLMVIASDPVTFPTPRPGHYAVQVNANDIAAMGASPRFYTLTMILPEGTPESRVMGLMRDAVETSDRLGITLIGGHSEISASVKAPILGITMMGELIAGRPFRTSDGRAGDAVIQVNPLAIEGTSILAAEHRSLLEPALGKALVDRAADFWLIPGLSVMSPAEIAARRLPVHAMHDPTEGGLATGLREIADASGTGLDTDESNFIVADETRSICRFLGIDPLGLISSGCLLFTVSAEDAESSVAMLKEADHPAAVIGRLTDRPGQYRLAAANGSFRAFPCFEVDELARVRPA